MAILHAEPTGWASWNVRITEGEREITRLSVSIFRNRGEFTLEGEDYRIESSGVLRTTAVLKRGAGVIARAEKPSFLRRHFEISSAGHHLKLESQSWSGREYALFLGGQEVGRITRKGFIGRKMEMEFPDEVPLVLQVLLTYLVLVQAKREAAAASSGS